MNKDRPNNTGAHSWNNAACSQKTQSTKAKNWQKENQNAIKAYNQFTAKYGLFADEHKLF